jgi:hypothetical protein
MKKIRFNPISLLCAFFMANATICSAQNTIFSDAQYLFNLYTLNNAKALPTDGNDTSAVHKLIYPVLVKYFKTADIETEIAANDFFKDILVRGASAGKIGDIASDDASMPTPRDKFYGFDVTNLADGFAKFIVKRTKEELNIAFFEDFKEYLNKPEYCDFKSLFPMTSKTFNAIGDEIYMYNAYIQMLREAFNKDLQKLPENLPSILENHSNYFDSIPVLRDALKSTFQLAGFVRDGNSPGNIVENLDFSFLKDIDSNAAAAYRTFQLLSVSFKNPEYQDHYWYNFSEVKNLLDPNQNKLLQIYLGLLRQEAKNEGIAFISNHKPVGLDVLLDNAFNKGKSAMALFKNCRQYIQNIMGKAESIEKNWATLSKTQNDSTRIEIYLQTINKTIDLLESAVDIETIYASTKIHQFKDSCQKYFALLKTSSDLAADINRHNYISAIVNVSDILNQTISKNWRYKINNAKAKIIQPDLLQLAAAQSKIIKYGNFMAALALAQNSDQVANIIETVAMPAGSARIKRETAFNVSLNAYCGLYYGYEKIHGLNNDGLKQVNLDFKKWNSFGLSAPIGFAISWGHQGTAKQRLKSHIYGWSTSAFLSVVDIGALAAFRFNAANDSVKTVSKIQLKDIISPGIFLSIGLPKSPISINLGYQLGPLLQQVTAKQNTYSQNYSRFSISICTDLPVLNFYSRSRKFAD